MWRPIPPPADPQQVWLEFLERARTKRLSVEEFSSAVRVVAWNNRLGPLHITDLMLGTGHVKCKYFLDIRFYGYVELLLTKLRIIDGLSLLRILYRYSTAHKHKPPRTLPPDEGRQMEEARSLSIQERGTVERWEKSYPQEEYFFKVLTRTFPDHLASADKAAQIVLQIGDWMQLFTDVGTTDLGYVNNPQSPISDARFALMELAVTALENPKMQLVVSHHSSNSKGTPRPRGRECRRFFANWIVCAQLSANASLNGSATSSLP